MLVDGQDVGTYTPTGTSYARYTTTAFTVAAGAHTIEFRGLDMPAAITPPSSTMSTSCLHEPQ